MKRLVCLFAFLVFFTGLFCLIGQEAKALTRIYLISPPDSSKVTTAPTFTWTDSSAAVEKPIQFHIKLALDPSFTSVIWEDSTIIWEDTTIAKKSIVYPGIPALTQWETYYWTIRAEVDSHTTRQVNSVTTKDTIVTYWTDFVSPPFRFFYTTARIFHIRADGSGDLPTIQDGIVWAAENDTVLVEPGVYYENLRFYNNGLKDSLLVTSRCCAKPDSIDTSTINKTIIDGSHLTRGKDKGSVVFFTSKVDSTSQLIGFTIRGGKGTLGTDKKTVGGGIYCDEGSSPTIIYNVITDNQAEDEGGGIFINSATPNILHNIITHNSTMKGSGGGIECTYSIEVPASSSSNSEDQGGESKEVSSPESRLKTGEKEIKNALNPKDATEVASALTPIYTTKSTANNPPVAVLNWYARKDTLIHRDKYLVGDTLFFDGTGSYDPDPGDSIASYVWRSYAHTDCKKTFPSNPSWLTSFDPTYTLPISTTSSKKGILQIFLTVGDVYFPAAKDTSDTITLNIQYPPQASGVDAGAAPGDTAWLDGSGSCDVNPGDILTYHWEQDSGAVVTIMNADSAKAFFVAQDSTFIGKYRFRLKVFDSIDSSIATVRATVAHRPTAVCQNDSTGLYGDTLVGFTTSDSIVLDGSLSHDNNPEGQVKYYLWEPVMQYFATKDSISSLPFYIQTNDTLVVQKVALPGGGLFKFRLRVKNLYGVISQNYDSIFYSVEAPAYANAGKDTIIVTGTRAYLTGSAIEINPDQRNLLKYNWEWKQRAAQSINIQPSITSQSIYFDASISGVYILQLRVQDGLLLGPYDEVKVVANQRPIAKTRNIDHTFEGKDTVLDASLSYDPDSSVFQRPDTNSAGGLKFTWSVKSKPPGAEEPVIRDADKPKARFTPYGTGKYEFWVLVNDTISVHQPSDTTHPASSDTMGNVALLTVTVDSTFAYPIIQGNLISHNFAGGKGGGVDCNNSSPDIINNIFFKNQSGSSGGAIGCRNFSTPQIKSNIFFGNISSDSTGGAIGDLKGQLSPSATRGFRKNLGVQYNDFWDNRGGTLYQASGTVSNNIYTFPRLIDPDFGDFRLDCTSPCIGKGDPLHPDIGSLIYYQPCASAPAVRMVSLSLFQNPVATAVVHLLVNTDAPLKTPPVAYITIGDHAPSSVYFTPISSKAYRGSYVFTTSGTAHISIFASSLLEKDTIATRDFGVQFVGTGKTSTLLSSDKKVGVLFPEGAVKEELYATCISVSADPQYQFEEKSEMAACGEAYQLGPSISFERNLVISFPLDGLDLKDKDKTCLSIYKYEDGKWNQLQSFLEGNSVCTNVKSLGVYRLIYDPRGKHIAGIPKAFDLFQNYPNPFNPETQIRYDLPVPGHVKLTVYNVLGQKVKVLVDEIQEAGYKSEIWDGKDAGGQEVASGIYFYKIEAQNFEKTKKMVLLK